MSWLKQIWDSIVIAFCEMEIARVRKELAVVNATIKFSRQGSTRTYYLNLERKVVLQERAKNFQRKIEQLRGEGANADQKSATQEG